VLLEEKMEETGCDSAGREKNTKEKRLI